MNVIGVVGICKVNSHSHAGVRDIKCRGLRLANLSPSISARRILVGLPEVCQLHPVEPKVLILEYLAPPIHQGMFLVIVAFAFPTIGFTLVPNGSPHGKRG